MGRRQPMHALEDGARRWHDVKVQVVEDGLRVDRSGRRQSREFVGPGREVEPAVDDPVAQRAHGKPVDRQESATRLVRKADGEVTA